MACRRVDCGVGESAVASHHMHCPRTRDLDLNQIAEAKRSAGKVSEACSIALAIP